MDLSSRIQAAVPVFIPPRQNSSILVDSLGAKSRGEILKKTSKLFRRTGVGDVEYKGIL